LLGAQNGRPAFGVGHLLEGCEAILVEVVDPIISDGEMAADPISGFRQRETALYLIDDPVALVHAGGE